MSIQSSFSASSSSASGVLLSYEEASALVKAKASSLRTRSATVERVTLYRAAGRTLARPVFADRAQPPFDRSTRDGFACRAAEVNLYAMLPVAGASRAGDPPRETLPPRSVWEVMTGAPVPAGADAVMMIEHVERGEGLVRLLAPRLLAPGENIVARGTQSRQGDELLRPGQLLGPAQIALAASVGQPELDVFPRPRVAILNTGEEIVPVECDPDPGKIRNSSASMLASLVTQYGGEPWILPSAFDEPEALDAALAQAGKADMLLVTGGVSTGKYDLVEPALLRLGARFFFTGIRIQPGKPLVFGEMPALASGSVPPHTLPVFGLPGNPVSSAVTFLLFAAPVLTALTGSLEICPRFALAELAASVKQTIHPGLTRFLPAYCDFGDDHNSLPRANLIPWQGSGDLTAMAQANCFLAVPENLSELRPGAIMRILLF
jgi:molybdopterin molybdotransferase